MNVLLTQAERDAALPELLAAGWTLDETRDALVKDFTFKGFVSAFGWMTQIAIFAEKWDHHPEWFNVYNRVTVTLTSHDVSGLSPGDIKMARKMDALAAK